MARPKAPPTRMQKSGNGHTYYLDGNKAPGVTTILSNGIPKPGLIGWGAGTVADFVVNRLRVARNEAGQARIVADDLVADALAWNATRPRPEPVGPGEELPRLALAEILKNVRYKDLEEASVKGTDVHNLAQQLAHGDEVDVPEHLSGHVRSYLKFLTEWDPVEAITERVVVNRRWGYMGKFDLIASFPGKVWADGPWAGRPVGTGLFDVKTARSGIFAEVALQLEAYRNAETMIEGAGEVPMPPVDFVAAIHVRADGYDVIPFDTDPSTFRTFLYAKQLGEWVDYKEGAAASIKLAAARPPKEAES